MQEKCTVVLGNPTFFVCCKAILNIDQY